MNNSIDWQDVENKIAIICYRFGNLESWHEDLAQELRIHAYYYSDNYYDLYRKAIDFWRKIQTKQGPEIPYYDLEITAPKTAEDSIEDYYFDEFVSLLRRELNRPGYNKWDENMLDLTKKLLEVIIEDIDPRVKKSEIITGKSNLNHYINQRLNLSWIAEELGVGYKRVVASMKFLEDIVRGLAAMKKIELPDYYFRGYYEE